MTINVVDCCWVSLHFSEDYLEGRQDVMLVFPTLTKCTYLYTGTESTNHNTPYPYTCTTHTVTVVTTTTMH